MWFEAGTVVFGTFTQYRRPVSGVYIPTSWYLKAKQLVERGAAGIRRLQDVIIDEMTAMSLGFATLLAGSFIWRCAADDLAALCPKPSSDIQVRRRSCGA